MKMTDNDDVGKLFVGGLSWETTKETLQSYFSRFGEVVDSVVMKNNETGRSRGFGFVTFKDPSCVYTVLQTKPHELNGRIIDAKECTPRSMQKNKKAAPHGKVFLGGLPPDITETDIRSALSRFGQVNHITIMCDQETKKCRGFGFLSFESEDSIEQACSQRFVNINGKQIECKKAQPRDGNSRRDQYGDENGAQRQGGYPNAAGWGQGGWNQPSQSYAVQSQGYGNYQSYNPSSAYGTNMMPYNSMTPTAQYAQPAYSSYGYGYQTAAPTGYAPQAAYSQTAVTQQPSGYDMTQSDPKAAIDFGTGYNNQAVAAATPVQVSGKGQGGYHPYRR